MNFKGSLAEYLTLVELSYNISFQPSIRMAPFEALCQRKYESPVCWDEVREKVVIGPELVQITKEKLVVIRNICV